MIDTVELKIDVRGKSALYFRLSKHWTVKYSSVKTAKDKNYLVVKVREDKDRISGMAKGEVYIPSSHYTILVTYSQESQWMKFNISIPKYRFGTNVLQLVDNPGDAGFDFQKTDIKTQTERTWSKFVYFIRDFRRDVLLNYVSLAEIEIRRIDFCYNLVFHTVVDLENYYESLKGIRMRYLREISNQVTDYQTAFMYVGKGYSFKVYKKGIEFRKNDRSKLEKRNEVDPMRFNVSGLQNLADRTLRHEMTLHKSYMSRIYRAEWFRRNDHLWQSFGKYELERYRPRDTEGLPPLINEVDLGWNERAQKVRQTFANAMAEDKMPEGYQFVKKAYSFVDTSGVKRMKNRDGVKLYVKALQKAVDFYMDVSKEVTDSNVAWKGDYEIPTAAKFSGMFFDLLLSKFWKKVEEFKMSSFEISPLMEENEKESRVLKNIQRLTRSKTLDQCLKDRDIGRSTYFKYKNFLGEYKITPHFTRMVMPVEWSYAKYATEVLNLGLNLRK